MYVPAAQLDVPPATMVRLYSPVLAPTFASSTSRTVPEGLITFRVTPVDGPGAGETCPDILILCDPV